ncbi:MAG: cysteine desulfurase DndA [Verrucomicrobia bacterium]|nr:cysteine desulfurase DndA [Verrucomicrobiota bacterium]
MSNRKQTDVTQKHNSTIYLDCNATTPIEPTVRDEVLRYFDTEFGNAGSRTHDFGTRAKQAVQKARDQVGAVVAAERDQIIFTSGATESNNLALLGLRVFGETSGRKHVISTQIEHKAVLEPLEELQRRGFEVELIPPNSGGWIDVVQLREVLRPDTLLVSVMHANNETGVFQPIDEIADELEGHEAYFHVDAAQTFGKAINSLRNPRIDLISLSGHKIYGPKGVGALIARRRKFERPPLRPLVFGGGQERGLRPGTLPVPLIAGLGLAAELAKENRAERETVTRRFRKNLEKALLPLKPKIHGDQSRVLPHVINLSFPGLDSEAVMVALKDSIAISNGSACTSSSYSPSHVLLAMGIPRFEIAGALRFSWCHLTPDVDWDTVVQRLVHLGVHAEI